MQVETVIVPELVDVKKRLRGCSKVAGGAPNSTQVHIRADIPPKGNELNNIPRRKEPPVSGGGGSKASRSAAQGFRAREKRRLARAASERSTLSNKSTSATQRSPSTGQYSREHLGRVNEQLAPVCVESLSNISDKETARGVFRPVGVDFRGHTRDDDNYDKNDVRPNLVRPNGALLNPLPNLEPYNARPGEHGWEYCKRHCISRDEIRRRPLDKEFASDARNSCVDNVEDGFPVGRRVSPNPRVLYDSGPVRDHHLVRQNQNEPRISPQDELTGSHSGPATNVSAGRADQQLESRRAANAPDARAICVSDTTVLPAPRGSFFQEGSARCPPVLRLGKEDQRRLDPTNVETQGREKRVSDPVNPIRRQDDGVLEVREDFRDWLSNNPLVRSHKTSLTLMKKESTISSEAQIRTLPCHFPQVDTINLEAVMARMNEKAKRRFGKIWRLTTGFDPASMAIANPMRCPTSDANQAVDNGLAVRLPADTPVTCHYFSVVEEKAAGDRRRPIHWAKPFNIHCANTEYEAQVDLQHFSRYFGRVEAEKGATFDLKAGFFQLKLPSPKLFTFVDEEGNVFGLSRLPMGICTAPELMQMVTSTLAGDPLHVLPKFKSQATTDVWIDNVLFTGSAKRVEASTAEFRKTVNECAATINWKDSEVTNNELDFIGMRFDFANHTVAMTDKNRAKIDRMSFATEMVFSKVETAVARLMYASSVTGVHLSKYYFALKFIRRRLSDLNRGNVTRASVVKIPPSVLEIFEKWRQEVLNSKPRRPPTHVGRHSHTMFTDSSKIGWGAVLIDDVTQQVRVVAGKWSTEEAQLHINVLEAKAVSKAMESFEGIEGSCVNLRIDNTSVVATVGKGYSKSRELNEEIRAIQMVAERRDIFLKKPVYVKSAENLADYWSRVFDERAG